LVEHAITHDRRARVNRSHADLLMNGRPTERDQHMTENYYLRIIYNARALLGCLTDDTFSSTGQRLLSTVARSITSCYSNGSQWLHRRCHRANNIEYGELT